MRYVEHRPPSDLDPHVECLWRIEDGPAAMRPLERVVPDGCIEIVLHRGSLFREWDGPRSSHAQPRAIVVGQLTRVLVLEPGAEIDTIGIRLRPTGARAILHVPLHELLDRTVPIDQALGRDGAAFARSLLDDRSPAARRDAIVDFLRSRLAGARPVDSGVTHAVGRVLGSRGRLGIARLARELGWSARRLERRFADDVGLPPKKLARIARLNAVLARIHREPDPDWADVALDLGFSDQSHLVREFGALVGASPADRTALAGAMTRFFASAARLSTYFGNE